MKAEENSLRYLATILTALLISGCSATGPSYETAKGSFPTLEPTKARLFFLRESTSMAGAVAAQVHVNGIKIADLYNGGFSYMDCPSGDAFIMIDQFMNPGEWTRKLNLDPGKEYYFRIWPHTAQLHEDRRQVMTDMMLGLIFRHHSYTSINSRRAGTFLASETPEETAKKILPTLKYTAKMIPERLY